MPYLPFPGTWPEFCPSEKVDHSRSFLSPSLYFQLADWFEYYTNILELNVWVSSTISSLWQDPTSKKWHVTIIRRKTGPNGQVLEQERRLLVKHVIFCTGMGNPNPPIPSFSGMDTFKGQILHSGNYKRALDYQGKKVVIIGAGTSGMSSMLTSLMFIHESAMLTDSPRHLHGLL